MGRTDSTKIPPDFPEGTSFMQWLKELHLWEIIATVETKKHGPLVILSCFNNNLRAKRAVQSLKIEDVNKEAGVKVITDRLQKVFIGEQYEDLFRKWIDVRDFKRNETHKSMVDYILEFEAKHAALNEINDTIKFCDIGLAMNLLHGAGITEDERKMVLAHQKSSSDGTIPFTFDSISTSLKRIFDSSHSISTAGASSSKINNSDTFTEVKQEAFYNNSRAYNQSNNNYRRSQNSYAKNFKQNSFKKRVKYGNGNNRIDIKTGKVSLCDICKSEKHWARVCPHRNDLNVVMLLDDEFIDMPCNLEDEDCNIAYDENVEEDVMFTSGNLNEINDNFEYDILMCEVAKSAILDSGCSKTVCGEQWLKTFIENLSGSRQVTYKPSNKTFKFGDGNKIISTKLARLPVIVDGHEFIIESEVVPSKIPLLLSKESMKRGKMILNFSNNTATLFGRNVTLHGTSKDGQGHYCLRILPTNFKENCNASAVDNLSSNHELPSVLNTTIDNNNVSSKVTSKTDLFLENDDILTTALDFSDPTDCYNNFSVLFLNIEDNGKRNAAILKLHKQYGHASKKQMINLFRNAKCLSNDLSKSIDSVIDSCDVCIKGKPVPPRPIVCIKIATTFNQTIAVDLKFFDNKIIFHMIDLFSRFSRATIIPSKDPNIIIKHFLLHWVSIFSSPQTFFSDNGGEFENEQIRDMCRNFNISFSTTPAYSPWCNGVCERHNAIIALTMRRIIDDTKCSHEMALAWAVSAKNALSNTYGYSPMQIAIGYSPNLPNVLTDKAPALDNVSNNNVIISHLQALHSARREYVKAESSAMIRKALRSKTRNHRKFFLTGDLVYVSRPNSKVRLGPYKVLGQDGSLVFLRNGGRMITAHCNVIVPIASIDVSELPTAIPIEDHNKCNNTSTDKLTNSSDDDNDEESSKNMSNSTHLHVPVSNDVSNSTDEGTSASSQIKTVNSKMKLFSNQKLKFSHPQSNEDCTAIILKRAGKATGIYKNTFNMRFTAPESLKDQEQYVDLDRVDNLELLNDTTG